MELERCKAVLSIIMVEEADPRRRFFSSLCQSVLRPHPHEKIRFPRTVISPFGEIFANEDEVAPPQLTPRNKPP